MTQAIPSAWQALIQKSHQATPWLFCWKLTLDSDPTSTPTLYVVNNPDAVTVGGNVYVPFPIVHSAMEQDGEGDLPQMDISLSNTGHVLAPYVDQGGGFLGRDVRLTLTNSDDLTETFVIDFVVAGCSLTTELATLRLQVDNWYQRSVPMDVFHVHRCRHAFGSARCSYIVNGAAAYSDCAKTIADCIDRGDDMVSRNLGRRLPTAFGGFPGMPV